MDNKGRCRCELLLVGRNRTVIGPSLFGGPLKTFETILKRHLQQFVNANNWESLQGVLSNILRLFINHRQQQQKHYFPLPNQKELAKRLSQCLRDNLNQLHELTLNVYHEVFDWELNLRKQLEEQDPEKYNWRHHDSGIALFFSGLFPFYENAEFAVKRKFLDLVQHKMLKMKKEVILSLSGFILCLLPALEGNLNLQPTIKDILIQTEVIVGTSEFFGEIWKAMLRTPRARLATIRYLRNRIPVSNVVEYRISDEDDSSDYDSEDPEDQIDKNQDLGLQPERKNQEMLQISDYSIKITNEKVEIQSLTEEEIELREQIKNNYTSENEEEQLKSYFYFYFPNKSKLVMQALAAGLQIKDDYQERVQVNRATMDFMISHMPIDSKINSIDENKFLTEAATSMLNQNFKDFAVGQKIMTWLFDHIEEDDSDMEYDDQNQEHDGYVDEEDPAIVAIVLAVEKMLEDSMKPSNLNKTEQNPIQVLLKIFTEEKAIHSILKHLTIPLLKCFKFHLNDSNQDNPIKTGIKNLMHKVNQHYSAMFQTLLDKLEKGINQDRIILNRISTAVDFIQFTFCVLLNYASRIGISQDDSQDELGHILQRILHALNLLSNIERDSDLDKRNQIIISSLDIIESILSAKALEKSDLKKVLTKESVENFNTLYVTMSQKLVKDSDDRQIHVQPNKYKLQIEIFKRYNKIMYKILKWQQMDQYEHARPKWLQMLIKSSQAQSSALCLDSVYYFLRILEDVDEELKQPQDNLNQNGIDDDDSIAQISDNKRRGGALTKIKYLILQNNINEIQQQKDFFREDSQDKNQIQYTAEYGRDQILKQMQIDFNKIVMNIYSEKKVVSETVMQEALKHNKSGCTDCWNIVMNLWNLMGLEGDEEKITEQLYDFDRMLPNIFSSVVISQLNEFEYTHKQDNAIKKFSTFWRITAQQKYAVKMGSQLYIPFQARDIDKFTFEDRNNLVLQKILGFLEDQNPTLRLSCRSWLQQNLKYFNRILEPIIEEFLNHSNFNYDKQLKTFVINQSGNYNNNLNHVIQNFGKLRNMILNSQDDIIIYLIARDCQGQVFDNYQKKFDNIQQTYDKVVQNEYDRSNKDQNRAGQDSKNPSNQQIDLQENHRTASDQKAKTSRSSFIIPKSAVPQPDNSNDALSRPENHLFFNHEHSHMYLDILVDISIMFIRVQSHPGLKNPKKESEMETVNASACEFLQLILKLVEKKPLVFDHLAFRIIWKLIESFHEIMLKKEGSLAMQDNIINLLEFILTKYNQQDKSKNKELSQILERSKLIDTIIRGLSHEQSFIRIKFIKFVEMYVPYITKFKVKCEEFNNVFDQQIDKLMKCHIQLLQRVDVSMFSVSRKNFKYQEHIHEMFNAEKASFILKQTEYNDQHDQSSTSQVLLQATKDLQINQQSDIICIIGGLQCILHKTLNIQSNGMIDVQKGIEDDLLEFLSDQENKRMEKYLDFRPRDRQVTETAWTDKLFRGDDKDPQTLQKNMVDILNSCIFCWNHSDFFSWSDYHFTRNGIFGFFQEDIKKIQDKLKVGQVPIEPQERNQIGQNEKQRSLDDIMHQHYLNPIQKKLIQLLRPIAENYPNQFMDGALQIWMSKSLLPKDVNVKRCYEKLIQIIICCYQAKYSTQSRKYEFILPVDTVIQSIITFISTQAKNKVQLVNIQRWRKKHPELNSQQITSETLLNAFLYTYLVYTASMYDPILPEDQKIKEFKKVYQKLFNYFHVFKQSHSPLTINWLLEILNIFSLKFGINKDVFDPRLKKEYTDLIVQLFTSSSLILTDQFNIEFQPDQRYTFVLPPTVYEFLWRYEYIQVKHKVSSDTLANNYLQSQRKQSIPDLANNETINHDDMNNSPYDQQLMQSDLSEDIKLKQRLEKRMQQHEVDNKLVYFNHDTVKQLKDSNFEYQHKEINAQVGSSIFKDMKVLMHRSSDPNLNDMYVAQSNFLSKIRLGLRDVHYQKNILVHSKYYAILTLKQVLFQFMVHLSMFEDEDRKIKILSIIMKCVVDILLKLKANKQNDLLEAEKMSKLRQKPVDTEVINEYLLEFFAYMIEKCICLDQEKKLLNPYRKYVHELFNNDNFFQTSKFNFQQWKRIINDIQTEESLSETIKLQLGKWQQNIGFFDNNLQQFTIQRILALKRFSFLIFVCDDEYLINKEIFEKLNKIIPEGLNRNQNQTNPNQIKERIFIMFITRVSLSRQSTKQLIESLKSLWPHLLSELVSIFEMNPIQQQANNENQYYLNHLRIEAIKLIELLASLNLEDFQMNQWIFLVDKIGMKPYTIEPQSARRQSERQLNNEAQGEVFKTFIVKYVGNDMQYTFNNVEEPADGLDEDIYTNYWTKREEELDRFVDESVSIQQSGKSPNNRALRQIQVENLDNTKNDNQFLSSIQTMQGSNMKEDKVKRTTDLVTKHARELQKSINDQEAQGSLIDRQDGIKKIEQDFRVNSEILNH